MSNNKYSARITPVPSISGNTVIWGWRADLIDAVDEKTYPFEDFGGYSSSGEALRAGTSALRGLVRAYDEVDVYQVDLYKPEPVVEEAEEENPEPEETKTEAEPEKETPEPEKTGTEDSK